MLDLIIIATYLFSTLCLGIYCGKNIDGIRDYTIANKKYSTPVLIMTFLATSFGAGSTVGDIAKVATDGIIFIVAISGFLLFCLYMGKYIAPNFNHRFHDMISAGDIMRYFYGSRVEKVVAIIGSITSALTVGGQITALGHIFGNFLGINYQTTIILSGLILIIYSTFGGVRAVAGTDVLQFFIIITTMPIMAFLMIIEVNNVSNAIDQIPIHNITILHHPKLHEYILLFLVSALPFLWLYPPLIQRFLMSNNSTQIAYMYNAEFFVRIIFMCIITIIALSCIILFPAVAPHELVPYTIKHLLPVGARGALITCILAASMSTADSHLNSATTLFTHNLIGGYFKTENQELFWMKITNCAIGCIAIMVAILNLDIVILILTAFGLWGATVTVPMLIGVMGIKTEASMFWVGFTISITVFYCIASNITGFSLLAPAIAVLSNIATTSIYILIRRVFGNNSMLRYFTSHTKD